VLLERTTRNVRLTAAGRQLYEEAQTILAAAAAATRRVHEAARGLERLVFGFAPGLRVSAAVRAFEQLHPETEIQLVHLNWFEQAEAVRDGRVDVGYLRRPFDDHGLRTIPINREPKVAVMPATHPLAPKRRLMLAQLEREVVLDAHSRRTATVEEKFELVAAGEGIALVPRSVARYYARPDVVHRPLIGAVEYETCLVTGADRCQQHLHEFVTVATQALGDGHDSR
jgi:DNA-binding transcriptional LysR family regulator